MDEKQLIRKYRSLISHYLDGELSAAEFSNQYLDEFKTEEAGLSEQTFRTLQRLFGEADAYCPDPNLRDDEWDIDEEALREAAEEADAELQALLERAEN